MVFLCQAALLQVQMKVKKIVYHSDLMMIQVVLTTVNLSLGDYYKDLHMDILLMLSMFPSYQTQPSMAVVVIANERALHLVLAIVNFQKET